MRRRKSYTRLGADLKAAREAKDLSLRELAAKMGVTHQRIILWEQGRNQPRAMYRALLESRLGQEFDWTADVESMDEAETGADMRMERRLEEWVA